MESDTRYRRQKLIQSIYAYFRDLADRTRQDSVALHGCQHLMALKDDALEDDMFRSFNVIWDSEHPEEDPIQVAELQWGLGILESDMRKQMRNAELRRIRQHDPRAWLRVVNGGLSENPAIPYERVSKQLVDF